MYSVSGWLLTVAVDLGVRSDTQMPNNSPVTTIIPIIRIPQNCRTTINLLGYDPDGDLVSCRYGHSSDECSSCRRNFQLDNQQCTLTIPALLSIRSYAEELILEDFPRNRISLTYKDGTKIYKINPFNSRSHDLPKDSAQYFLYDTKLTDAMADGSGDGSGDPFPVITTSTPSYIPTSTPSYIPTSGGSLSRISLQFIVEENEIVFKNQATSFSNQFSVITRKHGVSIPFNCSFPKKSRVSASFRAHKSDYVFAEAGFGNFTYKFQFYTDDRFVEVETQYPLEVALKELIFMEIQVASNIPNVHLFVESCKATLHDNPNDPVFYDIIKNGCVMDETFVEYSSTRTQYRFAMEAFAFIGDYSEVYMSCTVILCKSGDPGTRCTQGCITKSMGDPYRRKRSLTSESQQHFISQGPVRMKRQSPSNTDKAELSILNVNTLGVVIVVLLGFTIYQYRRSRISGYEPLRTQEL